MTVRRRTAIERAVARLRQLNAPPEQPRPRRRQRQQRYLWPEPGAIERLFLEAKRNRA